MILQSIKYTSFQDKLDNNLDLIEQFSASLFSIILRPDETHKVAIENIIEFNRQCCEIQLLLNRNRETAVQQPAGAEQQPAGAEQQPARAEQQPARAEQQPAGAEQIQDTDIDEKIQRMKDIIEWLNNYLYQFFNINIDTNTEIFENIKYIFNYLIQQFILLPNTNTIIQLLSKHSEYEEIEAKCNSYHATFSSFTNTKRHIISEYYKKELADKWKRILRKKHISFTNANYKQKLNEVFYPNYEEKLREVLVYIKNNFYRKPLNSIINKIKEVSLPIMSFMGSEEIVIFIRSYLFIIDGLYSAEYFVIFKFINNFIEDTILLNKDCEKSYGFINLIQQTLQTFELSHINDEELKRFITNITRNYNVKNLNNNTNKNMLNYYRNI